MVSAQKFQILETKLNEDTKDPEVGLKCFESHCKNRDVNCGGVAIYVNSRISQNRRYDINDPLLDVVAV